MTLPTKPDAVAHVSDAHWEAALRQAYSKWDQPAFPPERTWQLSETQDHARCLILLNEVPEPVDPLEVAIEAAFEGFWQNEQRITTSRKQDFVDAIRKHLAGMTIPEATQ